MSCKRLRSKDPKRGCDFGCLKDKWARFECKSRSNFAGLLSGVKPKVSRLLRRHLSGESDGREDVEAPIMRDLVPEWERRILCTVEHPRAAQISKKTQSIRKSVVTEFMWFAGQKGPWRLWVT
jgi:hypothetical protein